MKFFNLLITKAKLFSAPLKPVQFEYLLPVKRVNRQTPVSGNWVTNCTHLKRRNAIFETKSIKTKNPVSSPAFKSGRGKSGTPSANIKYYFEFSKKK